MVAARYRTIPLHAVVAVAVARAIHVPPGLLHTVWVLVAVAHDVAAVLPGCAVHHIREQPIRDDYARVAEVIAQFVVFLPKLPRVFER